MISPTEEVLLVKRCTEVQTNTTFNEWIYNLYECGKVHVSIDGVGEVFCDSGHSFQFVLKCEKFPFQKVITEP